MDIPSLDNWLKTAKQNPNAALCGMYLVHNGVVRETPKAQVREGASGLGDVAWLELSCNEELLVDAVNDALTYEGVYYVRAWINAGTLAVGDTMMYVLVGADIRPHCVSALERLVETIKTKVVVEREIFSQDFKAATIERQGIEVIAS